MGLCRSCLKGSSTETSYTTPDMVNLINMLVRATASFNLSLIKLQDVESLPNFIEFCCNVQSIQPNAQLSFWRIHNLKHKLGRHIDLNIFIARPKPNLFSVWFMGAVNGFEGITRLSPSWRKLQSRFGKFNLGLSKIELWLNG